jgi:nicotinamidase/pyrazinamidase
MNALIIVDVQNDFIPGGNLAVPRGDEIIPRVNSIQEAFTLVVATQDWHPPLHKSFASTHAGTNPFEKIKLHGLDQILWPDHCLQGSEGAQFHRDLNTHRVEAIFRKGMDPEIDSYSGFYDNGYRKSTGLAGYLRERNVRKVYVCGLAGDFCVYYTAKDSLKENFETYLIEDVTRSIDEQAFEVAKQDLMVQGGQAIRSNELYRYL